jgi:hypothetical protein
MPDEKEDNAARWRRLADETWTAANETTDSEARRMLVFIASAYGRLARNVKKRKSEGYDPAHWQRRADKARREAERLADPEAKRTMLEIADTYEGLVRLFGK